MAYEVSLDTFEGPLDLLLHLIEASELDIYDIPISQITAQYLDFIERAQSVDLEVAAEFLVMAATLMLIKARMLIPQPQLEETGADFYDDSENTDPRDELVQRLLEYKRYKDASTELSVLYEEASRLHSRNPSVPVINKKALPLPDSMIAADLLEAFQRVLTAHKESIKPFKRVPSDEINIKEAMTKVYSKVLRLGRVRFEDLFTGAATRYELIATFLAILELAKLKKVGIYQTDSFSQIEITVRESVQNDT